MDSFHLNEVDRISAAQLKHWSSHWKTTVAHQLVAMFLSVSTVRTDAFFLSSKNERSKKRSASIKAEGFSYDDSLDFNCDRLFYFCIH